MLKSVTVALAIMVAVVGQQAAFADDDFTVNTSSGSAFQQLLDAHDDGQTAVNAPTEEKAKEESNETFDTPHNADGD